MVTANKELLANVGTELFSAADDAGQDLLFEAAVAGGIPLIRALRESLRGEPLRRVLGIVNGTTNYILTKMSDGGATYGEALSEAQRLGYAERDPTADVEGLDAGAKAAIIASIAFGARVVAGDVYHEGISQVTAADIASAKRLGYVVKLLAICEQDPESGAVAVRVHPVMLPGAAPAGQRARQLQRRLRRGRRGRLADVLRPRCRWHADGERGARRPHRRRAEPPARARTPRSAPSAACPIRAIDETTAEYHLVLDVVDRPGVLHAVTGVFARHDVSIRTTEQEGLGDDARLVFITHEAQEAAVQATLRELRDLDVVERVGGFLRVIGA